MILGHPKLGYKNARTLGICLFLLLLFVLCFICLGIVHLHHNYNTGSNSRSVWRRPQHCIPAINLQLDASSKLPLMQIKWLKSPFFILVFHKSLIYRIKEKPQRLSSAQTKKLLGKKLQCSFNLLNFGKHSMQQWIPDKEKNESQKCL